MQSCLFLTENTPLLVALFLLFIHILKGSKYQPLWLGLWKLQKFQVFTLCMHACSPPVLFNKQMNLIFPLKIQVARINMRGW